MNEDMPFRCAHCLRLLEMTAEGTVEPCPEHPEGAVEVFDLGEEGDGVSDD